jgi:hypothetical protein
MSCADVATLLDGRSELEVCQQRNEGSCVTLAGPDAGAGGSSGGTASGGASASPCEACAAQCGGTPSCYQACGC